jgi:hypothetical protein
VFRIRSLFALLTTTLLALAVGTGVANAGPAPLEGHRGSTNGGSADVDTSSSFFLGMNTWATVALTAVVGIAAIALVATLVTRYQHAHHLPTPA